MGLESRPGHTKDSKNLEPNQEVQRLRVIIQDREKAFKKAEAEAARLEKEFAEKQAEERRKKAEAEAIKKAEEELAEKIRTEKIPSVNVPDLLW